MEAAREMTAMEVVMEVATGVAMEVVMGAVGAMEVAMDGRVAVAARMFGDGRGAYDFVVDDESNGEVARPKTYLLPF